MVKKPGTSLKELAQKLIAENTTTKTEIKTTAKRKTSTTARKPAPKKATAKKTVKPKRKVKE